MLGFERLAPDDRDGILAMSRLATDILREHYDPILGKAQNDYMLEQFQSVEAINHQLASGYQYYFGLFPVIRESRLEPLADAG